MNPALLLDSLVIFAYFATIITIGLRMGAREKTLEGYALGNRSIPWWAILASILAAEISAATFLGAPGEGYALRNFTYLQLAIGTILARLIVGALFIKPYYEFKVVSIYEYLELRFGKITRQVASMVFLISRALASGTRLYVAGILLVIGFEMIQGGTPTDAQRLWMYVGALVLIVALTALYTVVGGIKAVVWTDVIQACVLILSVGTALWILFSRIPGGWAGAREMLNRPDDLRLFDWGLEKGAGVWENVRHVLGQEYTLWAAFLGSTFTTMATHGTDQDMVQRMLTAKDPKSGRRAVILSGLADAPIVLSFLLTGILVWVYYEKAGRPAGFPTRNGEIFPYFIMHELPPLVRGLLVAGLLATAMGSLSTALNALATTFVKDWYQAILRPRATEPELLRSVRWTTIGFAILLIAIGGVTAWVVIENPKARILPIVLGIFGYTYGSLLGVFLIGMLTKTRGSDCGNVIGMFCGFVAVGFLSGLFPRPDWLPEIEFPWRITCGTLVTFAIAVLFRTPPGAAAARSPA
jgi:SSS family transporter